MTTLKDYLHGLVLDTQKELNNKYFPVDLPEDEDKKELEAKELDDHEIDDLVDEYIDIIKNRIIGE